MKVEFKDNQLFGVSLYVKTSEFKKIKNNDEEMESLTSFSKKSPTSKVGDELRPLPKKHLTAHKQYSIIDSVEYIMKG